MRRVCTLVVVLVLLVCPSACLVHEHRVGLGPVGVGEAAARQYYLFFGLVRLNNVDAQRLAVGKTSFSVRTGFTFVDILLAPFLAPFTITTRTVAVGW